MTQQHSDRHPEALAGGAIPGTTPGALPGLRDTRPGRLREALAARAEAKSGLRARRAERLARIRAGMAALADDPDAKGLSGPTPARLPSPRSALPPASTAPCPPRPPSLPPSLPPADPALAPSDPQRVPAGPSRSESMPDAITPEAATPDFVPAPDGMPPLRDEIAEPPLRDEITASPLRGAAPIPPDAFARAAADGSNDVEVSEKEVEALERFLAGLVGALEVEPVPQPARLAPAVVAFGRAATDDGDGARTAGAAAGDEDAKASGPIVQETSAREGACDGAAGLARLPGAGPGLVAALGRAGVPGLAALARLDPETLAARLGPIGRLIDLETWIAVARAETAIPAEGAASAG